MSSRKRITYSAHSNHAARSAHAKGERQFRTYDTSHIRPRKSPTPVIFGIILAVVVLALILWFGSGFLRSCSAGSLPEGQTVEITIPEGANASSIGTLLQEKGVIRSSSEFVNRVGELGVVSELKPGIYTFEGGKTLDEVITVLRQGSFANTGETFTIPEGFTAENTAARIAEAYEGKITAEDFMACVNNASAYVADFSFLEGAYNNSLEGFLFPKTYPIQTNATADSIVRMMLRQYQTEVAALDYSFADGRSMSHYQVLILASIIEKEATADNRATVASVFYNRLDASMPLQSDATTAYVVKRDPTAEDISNDTSAYSTYNNPGLPAGPICSPGLACLQAALAPENTSYLYFYFEENESGEMVYHFSETYEEHNNAIFS